VTAVWACALVLGCALRAVALTAARPYFSYVDEGNFLHPPLGLVRDGGWDPKEYLYPQFPTLVVTAAARGLEAAVRADGGSSLRDRIPRKVEVYDEFEPFAFLLLARCLSLVAGVAVLFLTGLLAGRVAGKAAGAAAALLAALAPALTLRASIASVDAYATLAVLGCVYLTDRTRDAARPGVVSFGAGLCAGAAFASKYPAVLVLLAFGVTTVLAPIGWGARARRLAAAGAGALLGAAAAMPALLTHLREVLEALRIQHYWYARMATEQPLWRQAFVEAESTLHYPHPEVSVGFAALALIGVVVGLRDRRIAPTVAGWCAFAASSFLLYGSQVFHPFRNLLPLVPLGCVAAALAFAWIRGRVGQPAWVDAAAAVWLVATLGVPLAGQVRARHDLEDSRKLAVDWLAANAQPGDEVVFVRDLGFLEQEIQRVPSKHSRPWWVEAGALIPSRKPRFVVSGVLSQMDGSALDTQASPALADYQPRFRAGKKPTMPVPGWWRGNDELVIVFERKTDG
jgi:hypothetical protein